MTRLAVFLSLLPSSVFAEVCSQMRPLWQAEWGQVDWVREFFSVVLHPLNLVLILIIAILIYIRWRTTLILGGLILMFLGAVQIFGRAKPEFAIAMAEGCIGNPVLVILVAFTLGLWTIWRGLRPGQTGQISKHP